LQRNPPSVRSLFDGHGRYDDGSPAPVDCSLRIAQAFVNSLFYFASTAGWW
jgi:hypothetical protein